MRGSCLAFQKHWDLYWPQRDQKVLQYSFTQRDEAARQKHLQGLWILQVEKETWKAEGQQQVCPL
jgi:hypothetical protein